MCGRYNYRASAVYNLCMHYHHPARGLKTSNGLSTFERRFNDAVGTDATNSAFAGGNLRKKILLHSDTKAGVCVCVCVRVYVYVRLFECVCV